MGLRLCFAQTWLFRLSLPMKFFPSFKQTRSRGHAQGVGKSQIPPCQVLGEEEIRWEMGDGRWGPHLTAQAGPVPQGDVAGGCGRRM